MTLIDTPGILSGSKQTMGRNYDFAEIVKWFAERSDLILLLFDAHKIDISDELKTVIESLHQHDEKMRLVLNKADALTTEEIMHVYGGTMWFLGKVFKTPEVKRSYMSSFWDQPLKNEELKRFMTEERERLLADLYALPAGARTRKVNEFIKRVRKGRAHCLVFNHLRKSMPSMMGKAKAKERLLAGLPDEFRKVAQASNVPLNDFPNPYEYAEALATYDLSKLPKASKELLQLYEDVIEQDLPGILQHFTSAPGAAPQSRSTLENDGELRGWLHKQATSGKWQWRYFVLCARGVPYCVRATAWRSTYPRAGARARSSTTGGPRSPNPVARWTSRGAPPSPSPSRTGRSRFASRRATGPTTSRPPRATRCPSGCCACSTTPRGASKVAVSRSRVMSMHLEQADPRLRRIPRSGGQVERPWLEAR